MSSPEQPTQMLGNIKTGLYKLISIETHSFAINLSPKVSFSIFHNRYNRQDFSLRCWLSETPRGQCLSYGGLTDYLHLRKRPLNINVIQSNDKLLYKTLYTFITNLPTAYLNIQNMENVDNGYQIKIL